MKVTTDVQLVPKLRMGAAKPQSLHMSPQYVKGSLYLPLTLTFSLYSSAHCVSKTEQSYSVQHLEASEYTGVGYIY